MHVFRVDSPTRSTLHAWTMIRGYVLLNLTNSPIGWIFTRSVTKGPSSLLPPSFINVVHLSDQVLNENNVNGALWEICVVSVHDGKVSVERDHMNVRRISRLVEGFVFSFLFLRLKVVAHVLM